MSTRAARGGRVWSFREALFQGLAPDGGLFVPLSLPRLTAVDLDGLLAASFAERARVMAMRLLGDEIDAVTIEEVVEQAFDFPVPLRPLGPGTFVLELFHGPTHAFKDVGARFMARMMSALQGAEDQALTILVATSGDTGGAVADAFFRLPGVRVVVLFPLGQVSARQEAQFSSLGHNVSAVAVRGSFDDCQRLVKEAFLDNVLTSGLRLSSANSINIGRLLPQIFYHVHAWAELGDPGTRVIVSVPSGNLGNLAAGLMARECGVPIGRFVAATNANAVFPDYLSTGTFTPRPSVSTLSNAMDVGNPSNARRVFHAFGHDVAALRAVVSGSSWSDAETRACIQEVWSRHGVVLDPHTAVGLLGLEHELTQHEGTPGVVLGTAHPAKFAETVEPLVGRTVPIPEGLARALDRPRESAEMPPRLEALREMLL